MELIELTDGRKFPQYKGETLSWSIGLYHTLTDQREGFPRMRTVIRAMQQYRPEDLKRERYEMLKASFGHMFGHNAKVALAVIDEEIENAERHQSAQSARPIS